MKVCREGLLINNVGIEKECPRVLPNAAMNAANCAGMLAARAWRRTGYCGHRGFETNVLLPYLAPLGLRLRHARVPRVRVNPRCDAVAAVLYRE